MAPYVLAVVSLLSAVPERGAELNVSGPPQWICRIGTIAVAGETRAWVVDACGHVFRSEDRGLTWRADLGAEATVTSVTGAKVPRSFGSRDTLVRSNLSIAHAVDEQTVVLGGYIGPWILRSSDAGRSWKKVALPSDQWLYAMESAGKRVWTCGSSGAIHRSEDGGATWKMLAASPFNESDRCMSLAFLDGNDGWASGMDGSLWSTSDGGDTWTPLKPPPHEGVRVGDGRISEVIRRDAKVAWIRTQRATFITTDGGQSWTPVAELSGEPRFVTPMTAESGRRLALGTRDAATPDEKAPPIPRRTMGVFRDGTVLVQDGGTFSVWRNGTLHKRAPLTAPKSTRMRVDGAGVIRQGRLFAWSGASLLRSDDDGLTWYEAGARVEGGPIAEAAFVNEGTVLARRADGQLMRSDCGGCEWEVSRSRETDAVDLDRALGRSASGVAECLRDATEGELVIEFGAQGCFGGNTNGLEVAWTSAKSSIDGQFDSLRERASASTGDVDAETRKRVVATLVDALQRPEQPSGCSSTTGYFARVRWKCGTRTGSANYESYDCNREEGLAPGVGGSTSGGGAVSGYARAIGLHNAALRILSEQR